MNDTTKTADTESFYCIHRWMLKKLKLKTVQLQIFAIVYGFSKSEAGCFSGSMRYLCDFTGAKRTTVFNALKDLTEKGYFIKHTQIKNGMTFTDYRVNGEFIAGLIAEADGQNT